MASVAVKRDAADGISSVIARKKIRSTFGAVGFADPVDHHTTGEVHSARGRQVERATRINAFGARCRSSSPGGDTNRNERDRQRPAFALGRSYCAAPACDRSSVIESQPQSHLQSHPDHIFPSPTC